MPQPYDVQHKGCAIICGAAPCVFEDLENARKLRPDATIVGVNNAAAMIPEIEHIWTQHPSDAQEYKKAAGKIIYIHSRPRSFDNGAGAWRLVVSDETWESIDYYWPTLSWISGSSGAAGALWAKHGMGFDEVIMAGIPLSTDSLVYCEKYPSKPTQNNNQYAKDTQVNHWLKIFSGLINEGKTKNIWSMSGSTKEMLGAPC
jgi:hypothetical protein